MVLPIFAGARAGFPTWGHSILHKFWSKLGIFNNHSAHFFLWAR